MNGIALTILAAGSVALLGTSASGLGQKMIEIDKAGNIRTSTGRDIGRAQQHPEKPGTQEAQAAPPVDRCAPGYTWSSEGLSAQMSDRTREFYLTVTQQYEREATKAHDGGKSLSPAREAEYRNALNDFMKAVPEGERKTVELGILPRLSWHCDAPALSPKASDPSQPPAGKTPPG